ncbi:germinal-center associated nuclear protein [Phtheirospermum japonicum]|uniref:Germinal-center associated nuclear protein n=1 Tax=Phtheirospermum japonicum TaxID=374723 RepID=A0A830BYL2_9LAMI|nr:germinal-center associated nuclear protein [Phtheirospermum japonicum]
MADRSRQPHDPMNRRNKSSSSSSSCSNYTKSLNPKYSNPDSNSIRAPYSNSSRNDNSDDGNQDFPTLVGTCLFMCPVEEKVRRERLRDLAVFERLHGDPAKTSPTLAVKKFCRTINTKDVQASDVRPVPVLEDTLNYLLNLMHSSDRPFEVVHDFIFDRTRSIRQDLSMQNVASYQVIHMYERMVKFHITSYYHLHRSSGTSNTASMCHLNVEQLMKALTTLCNLYEAHRAAHSMCQNEAEFYSFFLLLHLGSRNQGEPLSLWFRRVPSAVRKSAEVCFARGLLRYYRLGDYKRFIYTTEEEASFLQYCLIEPYINELWRIQAATISTGVLIQASNDEGSYIFVVKLLLISFSESEVESLCIACGLEISGDEAGKGLKSTKQSVISTQSRGFQKFYPIRSERIER